MSSLKRVNQVLSGLLMILCGVLMMLYPDVGYLVAVLFLFLSLTLSGLRNLVYYFSMARFAVGGKTILYRGLLLFDIGIFALSLADVPKIYIMLYLIGCHAFSGAVDILRALEAKQYDAPSWKRTLRLGILNVGMSVICLFFLQSEGLAVDLYASGLIISACARIASAFRKTAIAYIP